MTSNSIDSYYKILGVTANATTDQIKRAYRAKAKELHPDRNKNANAEEQFIFLTEAFEYLMHLKSGRTKTKQYASTTESFKQQKREQTRERAKEYSRMQYTEFTQSEYYKKSHAASVIFEHFYFISSLLIIFGLPITGYVLKGWTGVIVGFVGVFLTVSYWSGIFTQKLNIDFKQLKQAIIITNKKGLFCYIIVSIINILLFFRFSLNTQISTWTFLFIVLLMYAIAYVCSIKLAYLKSYPKRFILLGIVPTVFNLFFLINFLFSSNPVIESYNFEHQKEWYGGYSNHDLEYYENPSRLEKTGYIHLENNKYEEFHWFRMFFDVESTLITNRITYTFEDGLLGLRVLKSYEFR